MNRTALLRRTTGLLLTAAAAASLATAAQAKTFVAPHVLESKGMVASSCAQGVHIPKAQLGRAADGSDACTASPRAPSTEELRLRESPTRASTGRSGHVTLIK